MLDGTVLLHKPLESAVVRRSYLGVDGKPAKAALSWEKEKAGDGNRIDPLVHNVPVLPVGPLHLQRANAVPVVVGPAVGLTRKSAKINTNLLYNDPHEYRQIRKNVYSPFITHTLLSNLLFSS